MIDYTTATSRCWVEVDLDALGHNVRFARGLLSKDGRNDRTLIPVLKANAYGMGAVPVARHLWATGLRLFAVATVQEGLEIKSELPGADVLVMGFTPGALAGEAIRRGLIMTLAGREHALLLSRAAAGLNLPARVHVKLNTGLNRLGFEADALPDMVQAACLPGLSVEGLFTHLALRDEASDRAQLLALGAAHDALRGAGFGRIMLHALDSIGMVRYPNDLLDGVRLGGLLCGVCPQGYAHPEHLRPVARFVARVAQIRELPQGAYIGYDDEHPLPRAARVATLTVGYADGYPRLNSAGCVEIRGRRAPVVGLVCMDQMMVDVSGTGAREGDEATLFGGSISLDEYAGFLDLNRNDALARLSRRVPRVYILGGRPVRLADYFTSCDEVEL